MSQTEIKVNILIVDDNPTNLTLLSKLLSKTGYTVQSAINGQVALASVQKTLPDVVLLDIMMPDLDGYEVCRQLKAQAQTCDVPIIFMSALTEMLDKVKAFEVGGVDYITKPFQHAEVLARVKTHLALSQAQRQLQIQNEQLQQEIAQRQRTEIELREREELFRGMFENHSAPMYLLNPIDGRVMEANEAATRFYGYSLAELQSMSIYDINQLNRTEVDQAVQQIKTGQLKTFEFPQRLANGEIRYVDIHSSPIIFKGQTRLFSIIHDMTERHRAELELRKLSHAVEQSDSSIVITDRLGRIEFVNHGFTKVTGYTIEEAMGQNPRILKSGQHSPEAYEQLWATLLNGEVWQGEFVNKRKNGELYWETSRVSPIKDTQGKITHFVAVKDDITARKKSEQKLQQLLAQQSAILDNAIVGIGFVKERFIIWANSRLAEMSGYTMAELTHKLTSELYPTPEDYERMGQELYPRLAVGQLYRGEWQFKRKEGTLFWGSLSVQAIDVANPLEGAILVLEDVTERRQNEITLRQYERMVSATNDHMSLVDTDYRYQVVNQAYTKAHGKSEAEIVGHMVSELHGQVRFEEVIKAHFDQCLSGQQVHYQAWFDYPQLGRYFMDVTYAPYRQIDGTVAGVVVSARDITELKEFEQRLAYIIDFLPEATFVINQTGQVIAWNKAIATLTGVKAAEMLGRGNYEYALPFYGQRRPVMIDLLFLPEAEVMGKYSNVHYEGDTIYGESHIANFRGHETDLVGHAAKLYNFQGDVVGAIETILDITATKKATQALQQANKALEKRVDELAMLNQVTQMVTTLLDLATALEIVARMITQLLNVLGTSISLLNAARTEFAVLAYFSMIDINNLNLVGQTFAVTNNPTAAKIIVTKQSVVVQFDEAQPHVKQMMQREGVQQLLHVPLQIRGEVIGIITINSEQAEPQRKFTLAEIKLAETVAGQVAGTIENARLFKEEQQQRQIAESLREVTSILNRSLDQKTVLAEILEQLGRVVAHHGAAILLKQQHHLVIHDAVGIGRPHIGSIVAIVSDDPVAQVFRQKQPIIIEDTFVNPHWSIWTEPDSPNTIRSWIGVPLLIGDKIIGVLTIDNFMVQAYRLEDAHIVQIFADQAAVAIQNSQLFSAVQQANLRIQDELAFAQEIQRTLTPSAYPYWSQLEVICYSMPAYEIGGDFYTYHQFESQQKYAFALGDVSGKGVSAALLMAACLSRFEATLAYPFTPPERLIYLDKVIEPYTKPRHQNCALCYVEIELKSQELGIRNQAPTSLIPNSQCPMPYALLHIVNAGCIPPYLKRANGQVEFHEIGGFALGQGLGALVGYQQLTLELSKGDLVIMVSDGVIEAKNSSGDMLGFTQFEEFVIQGVVSNAAEMMAQLQFELANFMGNAAPHDDLTLIVIEV